MPRTRAIGPGACRQDAVDRRGNVECPIIVEDQVRLLRRLRRQVEANDVARIAALSRRVDARNVVGLDLPAEAPQKPDLVLDNYGALDVATAVDRILAACDRPDGAGAREPARLVAFKTKAESLEALAPLLRNGRVLPQIRFSIGDWCSDAAGVLAAITAAPWGSDRVIVRSSARGEDGAEGS